MNETVPLDARRAPSLRLPGVLLPAATLTLLFASMLCADDPSKPSRAPVGPHIVIRTVQPTETGTGPLARYGLTRRDFDAIVATVPGIVHAVPVRESIREIRVGDQTVDVTLTGTLPDYRSLHSLRVFRGRFFTDDDQTETRNVVVVGSDVVDQLFPEQSPIGEYIWIDQKVFVVVGEVVAPGEAFEDEPQSSRQVFLPLSSMRRRLGDREIIRKSGSFEMRHVELSRIDIRLSSADDVVSTATIVRRLLDRRHDEADFVLSLPFQTVEGGQK
ncbi:ABC transporter permease [Maioricimonas rarisocia]|nr:ABC transporter permease [Maioricimonas rarisocia]